MAAALKECHRKSSAQGKPLALKIFVAGRNRLENDGATALAEAFGVSTKPELLGSKWSKACLSANVKDNAHRAYQGLEEVAGCWFAEVSMLFTAEAGGFNKCN